MEVVVHLAVVVDIGCGWWCVTCDHQHFTRVIGLVDGGVKANIGKSGG